MSRSHDGNALSASRDIRAKLRHGLIGAVSRTRPTLFRFAADAKARAQARVRRNGSAIDVERPSERKVIRISSSMAVYLPEIIGSFSYYAGSVEPVRVRRSGAIWELIDFSTPRFHPIKDFDDFTVLCPSLTEPFVTTEQYLDFAQLRPGQTVIDLGAYAALTSIAFSKVVGAEGTVLAVEPDPLTYFAAEANIAAHRRVNGLANIILSPLAVSDAPGLRAFSSEASMGSALAAIVGRHRGEAVEVECVSLQGLVDRYGLSRVDFLKMDIEGAEVAIIPVAGSFLARYKPRLIIEPHTIHGVSSAAAVSAALEAVGYDCQAIEQTGLDLPLLTAVPRQ